MPGSSAVAADGASVERRWLDGEIQYLFIAATVVTYDI